MASTSPKYAAFQNEGSFDSDRYSLKASNISFEAICHIEINKNRNIMIINIFCYIHVMQKYIVIIQTRK